MKALFLSLSILCASLCFAGYEVIGKTDERCSIDATILRVTDKLKVEVLIIEQRRVHVLSHYKTQMGISRFISKSDTTLPPTFEATIMAPQMSRLSELVIFFSGRYEKCLIEI